MPDVTELRVGGLAPLSTCDWPGELVATVFCQGCAWDCAYCHNSHLRPHDSKDQITWQSVLTFLQSRRGLLDAVVFSGGEPTLQPALLSAVASVRNLGFRVGLHTAGMASDALSQVLPLIDWVGFDVKAPLGEYSRITGVSQSGAKALASLRLLLESGVSYEVRTTLHPALLTVAQLMELRDELLSNGVTNYAVQHFRPTGARLDRLPLVSELSQPDLPADFSHGFLHFQIR